jgi:phosphoribosylanthranilate isomerase
MNIKVSGITSIQQLMELDTLDIDYVGLVFDKDSDQYAEKNIPSDQVKSLDFDIKKVGIFVNAEFDEIIARIESYNLDLVQLNGSESPDFCRLLAEQEIMLIKSFYLDSFNSEIFADTLAEYDEVCDY